jgi:hypothetical protein
VILLFSIGAVEASTPQYQCRIHAVYVLNNDGSLSPSQLPEQKERSFAVDRESGMVVGQGLSNATTHTRTVLDYGDDSHPFKLVWVHKLQPGRRQMQTLVIEENAEGQVKPFVAQSDAGMITGTCQY